VAKSRLGVLESIYYPVTGGLGPESAFTQQQTASSHGTSRYLRMAERPLPNPPSTRKRSNLYFLDEDEDEPVSPSLLTPKGLKPAGWGSNPQVTTPGGDGKGASQWGKEEEEEENFRMEVLRQNEIRGNLK